MDTDDTETFGKQLMDQLALNLEVIINTQRICGCLGVCGHYILILLFNKD